MSLCFYLIAHGSWPSYTHGRQVIDVEPHHVDDLVSHQHFMVLAFKYSFLSPLQSSKTFQQDLKTHDGFHHMFPMTHDLLKYSA